MSLILSKVNVTMGFLACRVLGCQQNKSGVMAQWLAAAIPLFQREFECEALDLTRLGGCNGYTATRPSIGADYMSIQRRAGRPGYGITASRCEPCNPLLIFLIQIAGNIKQSKCAPATQNDVSVHKVPRLPRRARLHLPVGIHTVFQTRTSSHPTPPEYVFCIETERILAASSVKLQYAIAHSLKNKIPNRTCWDMQKCNGRTQVPESIRRIYHDIPTIDPHAPYIAV